MTRTERQPTPPRAAPTRFRFGGLVLDTGRRRLTDTGQSVRLGKLTFDLLQALVEAAPNAVSHEELATRVWGARPVNPETLSQRVKLLRDALSDDAEDPKYVEVIRGHGYRLIPRVRPLRSWAWSRHGRDPLPLTLITLTGLALMASLALWYVGGAKPATIAVVPFSLADDTGVDDGRLGEELAQAVIDRLSRLGALRVFPSSATFAFRDNLDELHRRDAGLRASHVLKGTIQPRGTSIRMTAQLIDCATGYQVWSGTREHSAQDSEVTEQLARYVVRELEIALTPGAVPAAGDRSALALTLDSP